MLPQFVAQEDALFVFVQLPEGFIVGELLPPCLDGEVGLAVGDDGLAGVAILDDEVAGVAGEAVVPDLALRA